MSGPEKQFENRIKRFLTAQGSWFVKYWGGGKFTTAGVPDLLVCHKGKFIGIEIKAEHGRPSELQKVFLTRICNAGGWGILLYPKDFEKFKSLIHTMDESMYRENFFNKWED